MTAQSLSGARGACYLAAIVLACSMLACRTSSVAREVNADAAACIPSDTIVLAGVDLDRLRAAPLYSKLPAAVVALAGSYSTASSALLAYNGKELLAIARGQFAKAPPGSVLAAPNLALFGSEQLVTAAMAQYRSHAAGAPAVLARAKSVAADRQIWIVMQGGVDLPLTGNAANLNHLLRNAESASVTVNVDSELALAITVLGRTADSARNVEETVRAEITLAAAAEARRPDLAKLLRSISIDRDDRTVRIMLSADADVAAKLLAALVN